MMKISTWTLSLIVTWKWDWFCCPILKSWNIIFSFILTGHQFDHWRSRGQLPADDRRYQPRQKDIDHRSLIETFIFFSLSLFIYFNLYFDCNRPKKNVLWGEKFLQRCHVNRPINQKSVGFKKWAEPNDKRMVDRYSVTVKRCLVGLFPKCWQ